MEDLTKQQLILLALLVSFVTSIAASIATASLLDQAPKRVTETIHRVVERTVEIVVPSDDPGGPAIVTQEKTIIVKEEDAITEAIVTVSSSLVRLYLTTDAANSDADDTTGDDRASRFRALAVVSVSSGIVVTSSPLVVSGTDGTYEAILPDGSLVSATVQERLVERGIAVLSVEIPVDISVLQPVVFGDDTSLRLGQTVLGLGGNNTTNISIGIISNIIADEAGTVSELTASISSDTYGMPLVNLFGEVVGLATVINTNRFIPGSRVSSVSVEAL